MRQWLEGPQDQRQSTRSPGGALVAHYWTGGAPAPRMVANVSENGAYIQAPDTWYPGTVITLTLQPASAEARSANGHGGASENVGASPCAVRAVVVRSAAGGFGVHFMFADRHEKVGFQKFLRNAVPDDRARTEHRSPEPNGQALIEFALILPLLFLLIMNVVNFGAFFFAWITVANAARSGGDYQIMGAATVNTPPAPSTGQIAAVVTQDISSLLNRASLQVRVCTKHFGAAASCVGTAPGGTPALLDDPEAPLYVSASVDVTYTFVPPISAWNFPNLGIYLSLPSTTIHRRAVMRMMN